MNRRQSLGGGARGFIPLKGKNVGVETQTYKCITSEGVGWAFSPTKTAFTLAEVLITLGIIGIVAAMTLPTLIGNYQKHVTVNKLKKSYTTLSQMFVMAQKDNGGMENWDFSNFGDVGLNSSNIEEHIIKVAQTYFVPYLDILEDCGTRCKKVEKINYKWLSDELLSGFYDRLQYTIFLKDGSIIYISLNNNGIKIFDILISVDINGRKGPNVVGKDVFCYELSTPNAPYSGLVSKTNFWGLTGVSVKRETLLNDSQRGCNKNASGQYCGALIQYDNWEISDDYPW